MTKRILAGLAVAGALVVGALGWGAPPVAQAGEDWDGMRAAIESPEATATPKQSGNGRR